jgi:hypothetical protein
MAGSDLKGQIVYFDQSHLLVLVMDSDQSHLLVLVMRSLNDNAS